MKMFIIMLPDPELIFTCANLDKNFGRNCFLNNVGQLYNYITNDLGINNNIAVSTDAIW